MHAGGCRGVTSFWKVVFPTRANHQVLLERNLQDSGQSTQTRA